MKCPFCLSGDTKVVETRTGRDGFSIRRRRECMACGRRFTTFERIDDTMPMVVKKDGRREPYNRDKLLAGIRKAFEKRPVSVERQEGIVDEVERYLLNLGEKEVPYVRFASVYRQFRDISDFWEVLKKLVKEQNGG